MAFTNFMLLIFAVITLPIVENAPNNILKTPSKDEELRVKLVFVDRDADDKINNDSQMAVAPNRLNQPVNNVARRPINFSKAIASQNGPSSVSKTLKSSSFPKMDDERQIWDSAVEYKDLEEDESYYNRPITLPRKIKKHPNPVKNSVAKQVLESNDSVKPSACDMAIVICCHNLSNLKKCFESQGCPNATEDMFPNLCSSDYIDKIIKNLGKYYKEAQEK